MPPTHFEFSMTDATAMDTGSEGGFYSEGASEGNPTLAGVSSTGVDPGEEDKQNKIIPAKHPNSDIWIWICIWI